MLFVMMIPTKSYLSNFKNAVDGGSGSAEFRQAPQVKVRRKQNKRHFLQFLTSRRASVHTNFLSKHTGLAHSLNK